MFRRLTTKITSTILCIPIWHQMKSISKCIVHTFIGKSRKSNTTYIFSTKWPVEYCSFQLRYVCAADSTLAYIIHYAIYCLIREPAFHSCRGATMPSEVPGFDSWSKENRPLETYDLKKFGTHIRSNLGNFVMFLWRIVDLGEMFETICGIDRRGKRRIGEQKWKRTVG